MLPHQQQQWQGQTMAYRTPAQNEPQPSSPLQQQPPAYMSPYPPPMQQPLSSPPGFTPAGTPQGPIPTGAPQPAQPPMRLGQNQEAPPIHHAPPPLQSYGPPPTTQHYSAPPPPAQHLGPPPVQNQGPPSAQQYGSPPLAQNYGSPSLQQNGSPPTQGYYPGQPPPPLQPPQAPQYNQLQPNMMRQPVQYSSMAPQPPRQMRLDPHAMPSAAQLITNEIEAYKETDRQLKFRAPATLPPLVTTLESQKLKMSLQDEGCVRPCHMRSTIYQVPTNKDLLEGSGLEFSVVVKPFDEGEVEGKFFVPLSESTILRCNRCKAYINPFSRNSQCCICNYTIQGLQELHDQSPELHLGSYEFRVTPEYYREQIAESRRPHIVFAIEMTASSRHLVHYLAKNLASVIKSHFPKDFMYSGSTSPLVGFATYNSKITLYDVRNGGHAYVISDMTTVISCASTSKFLVDPAENFDEIENFLTSLPQLCNEQSETEQQTVLGPVVEAVLRTCAFDTSNSYSRDQKKVDPKVIPTGKVYLLHSTLPTYGDESTPGRLETKRNIDDLKKTLGTENESKTLAVEGKYYTKLAQKCISHYASGVELFLFPPHPRAYLNIATLGELSKLTGTGVISKYQIHELDNFLQDLKISLQSTMGFDASMRVRTSTGISPVRYIGNFNTGEVGCNLEMSAVNTTSNFVVQMKYDDKLNDNDLVVVQFAMIYTSVCGERRVRVHNLALQTCQTLGDLYKSACCDTLMNVLLRDTVEKMRVKSLAPKLAKEQLTIRVISILAAYRKNCTENQAGTSSQLILPEGLKLLPVYLCGALKCDAIDGGFEMFPDDKVLAQLNLLGALPSLTQVTIYPRMYSIEACEANDEENEYGLSAILTRCFNLAYEEGKGQCYILENGYYLFIFFPSTDLGQNFLQEVFGAHKDDQNLLWEHRQSEANESKFIEELIEQIITERRRALKINIVRQGKDRIEAIFKTFLYEDKKTNELDKTSKLDNASYVDILVHCHNEIRAKLSQ